MRHRNAFTLSALALLLAACGGSHSGNPSSGLTVAQATASASAVLGAESSAQASGSSLPVMTPSGTSGTVYGLVLPSDLPSCATVTTTGPDANGFTHQTWTFSHCSEGDDTLDGSIDLVFKTGDYQITFNHLVRTDDDGEEVTTLDGTKHVVIDATAMTGTVTVTNFTVSHTEHDEPDENRTFTYNASWHSDWSAAGTYKLWGTFSLAANADPVINGTVDQAAALTWMTGCCSPVAGVMTLVQGPHTAVLTFGPACGTVSIVLDGAPPVQKQLRRCH